MKSSSYIDLQRFMLIPTKFPLTRFQNQCVFPLFSDKKKSSYDFVVTA